MPIDDALPSFLAGLEQDPSLDDPHNLRQRIEALDRLDACLAQGPSSALQRRAERIAPPPRLTAPATTPWTT
jgi:hypothetical protein